MQMVLIMETVVSDLFLQVQTQDLKSNLVVQKDFVYKTMVGLESTLTFQVIYRTSYGKYYWLFFATGDTPNTNTLLHLENQNGNDGSGVDNYVAQNLVSEECQTSQGWLGYTRTADNQGAFFIKQRNAASSSYPETIRFPSSGGVTFGGGANSANTLDDYEEGTFTPTLNFHLWIWISYLEHII